MSSTSRSVLFLWLPVLVLVSVAGSVATGDVTKQPGGPQQRQLQQGSASSSSTVNMAGGKQKRLPVCGASGDTVRIASVERPSLPQETPHSYNCTLAIGAQYVKSINLLVVGPTPSSPIRPENGLDAMLPNMFHGVGEIIQQGTLQHLMDATARLFHKLKLSDFLHTFLSPRGVIRAFKRQTVVVTMQYKDGKSSARPLEVWKLTSAHSEYVSLDDSHQICSTTGIGMLVEVKHWWYGEQLALEQHVVGSSRDRWITETCTIKLPAVVDAKFVAVRKPDTAEVIGAAKSSSSLYTDGDGPRIYFSVSEDWDTLVVQVTMVIIGINFLGKALSKSPAVQFIVATLFGLLIVLGILLFFAFKDLQKSALGKAGIVAVFAAGGMAAIWHGVFSSLSSFILFELQHNIIMQVGFGVLAVVSAILVHWKFRETLSVWAVLLLKVTDALLRVLLIHENIEYVVVVYGFLKALQIATRMNGLALNIPVVSFGLGGDSDSPRDSFSQDVYQAKGYTRGAAAQLRGRNMEERMKIFQEEGRLNTERELDRLAAIISSDPGRYANKLKNPNHVVSWAGEFSSPDRNRF